MVVGPEDLVVLLVGHVPLVPAQAKVKSQAVADLPVVLHVRGKIVEHIMVQVACNIQVAGWTWLKRVGPVVISQKKIGNFIACPTQIPTGWCSQCCYSIWCYWYSYSRPENSRKDFDFHKTAEVETDPMVCLPRIMVNESQIPKSGCHWSRGYCRDSRKCRAERLQNQSSGNLPHNWR